MNTPLILKISAALLLGVCPFARADKVGPKGVQRNLLGKEFTEETTGGTSIGTSVDNGDGVATYKDREVWKGKVKECLNGITELVDGEECAAVFDGKRLVWENKKGDGAKLEPKLKELLKQAEKLRPKGF